MGAASLQKHPQSIDRLWIKPGTEGIPPHFTPSPQLPLIAPRIENAVEIQKNKSIHIFYYTNEPEKRIPKFSKTRIVQQLHPLFAQYPLIFVKKIRT